MFQLFGNKKPKFQENHKFTFDNRQYTVKRVIKPKIRGNIITFRPDPTQRTDAQIQAGIKRTGRQLETHDFFEDKEDKLRKDFEQDFGQEFGNRVVMLTIDSNDKITSVVKPEKGTSQEKILEAGKIPGILDIPILPESYTRYLAFEDNNPQLFNIFNESNLTAPPVVSSTSTLPAVSATVVPAVVGGFAPARPSGYRNKTKRGRRKSRRLRHKKLTRRHHRKY
jgi:hypothetical protein